MDRRVRIAEVMDQLDVDPRELRATLGMIRWFNAWLGGSAGVLRPLRKWSKTWAKGRTIRILDIGSGSGDIPLAIVRWAARAGHDVRVTAVDRHPTTLALARQYLQRFDGSGRIELVQADALKLPFARASFDYVVASMFLHHLDDIEVLTVLKIMSDLAREGVVWNDLLRNRWALSWSWLLTLGWPAAVRHDAMVSVRAGFTRQEVMAACERVSIRGMRVRSVWGYRFTAAVVWKH